MSLIERLTEKNGRMFAKQIIEEYMKKHKFDTIEELLKNNSTLAEFDQNTRMENLVNIIQKHGFQITEADYQDLIQEIKTDIESKQSIKMDEEVEYINNHKIVTLTDQTTGEKKTVIDDVSPDKSVTEEAKEIQESNKQFQSTKENNTIGIMNKLESDIKITPDTLSGEDAKKVASTEEEEKIAKLVKDLENELGHEVEVDFNSKIIYDYYDDNKYTIDNDGEEYKIVKQNSGPKLVKTNLNNKSA